MAVGYIEMSNGQKLPHLGLGMWLAYDHAELKQALRAALDAGYRYFDTASGYGNESALGDVLQEYYDAGKLKREDIFITSKLPYDSHETEAAEKSLKKSLENLRTNYLDLYLIHAPLPFKINDESSFTKENLIPLDIPLIETWSFMERQYKAGTLKSIGISNFNARQIRELYQQAEVKPHNLQVELHILLPQKELLALCKELNISVTSYSTLGSPGRGQSQISQYIPGDCLNHPVVKKLAQKYNKTSAQILLRHTIQQGVSVIPKSTNPERLKQNINVFDFELSGEDQQKLHSIQERVRFLIFNFAEHHPNITHSTILIKTC
ncbi:Aldo-ket-red domain-containing protein [Aphelenchoides bicaudatus]|nr:Aldo-ket-red domain-containing protein [Aphelenchoides bicaudatus]